MNPSTLSSSSVATVQPVSLQPVSLQSVSYAQPNTVYVSSHPPGYLHPSPIIPPNGPPPPNSSPPLASSNSSRASNATNQTLNLSHRHWKSNICDCCIDTKTCCYAFVCPCCAFGKIVNHLGDNGCGRGLCCLICPCSVFIRSPYRKKLRVSKDLPAKPCNDCCTSLCCPCCALAQELREIESAPVVQQMA